VLPNYNENRMEQFKTLIEALEAAPGDRAFVTFCIDEEDQETITFAEFRQRANSSAHMLHSHGLGAGERVIIVMPQGIPAMATFVGAMMLGAVPAFLAYPNFKVEPSKYRAGLSGVSANLAAQLVVIDSDFPEDLLAHVSLDHTTKLIRAGGSLQQVATEPLSTRASHPHEVAFLQHSAGTTGLQKGVALTHAAVLTQLKHLQQALKLDTANDRIYNWLPLYHDMGLIACFMLPMACHIPVIMQAPIDWVMHPEIMLEAISKHRCTLAWLPNFAFQFVPRRTSKSRWSQYDLSSLRALINCSEPVRASSMDEFFAAFEQVGLKKGALQSSYAMAENVFAVTQSDLESCDGAFRISVDGQGFRRDRKAVQVPSGTLGAISLLSSGRLLPNNKVRIVCDAGSQLEDGNIGEIFIQSDSLFDGYFNRPDLTADAIVSGWYRTGDLGFMLHGELFVVGRKKDLIIVGGENLYPQDIEEIIAGHPAIRKGRVVAMGSYNPDAGTEDILVIAEVIDEELLKNAAELDRELRTLVVAGIGVAVRKILLKSPGWIVKSTAGKPARAATREKLSQEHPEI
jgi:fatty-acyl-CoA synthase